MEAEWPIEHGRLQLMHEHEHELLWFYCSGVRSSLLEAGICRCLLLSLSVRVAPIVHVNVNGRPHTYNIAPDTSSTSPYVDMFRKISFVLFLL